MVVAGPEVIGVIAGLIAFTEHLVTQLRSLSGNGRRYTTLANEVETLHQVLQNIETEYSHSVNSGSNTAEDGTNSLLFRCVQDTSNTCLELDALARKILKSKSKALRASWESDNVEALRKRLEGNKSTLLILLGTISCVFEAPIPRQIAASSSLLVPALKSGLQSLELH